MKRVSSFAWVLASLCAAWHLSAWAASVNILWYTYAAPTSEYRSFISTFATIAGTYPESSGLNWNLTFMDPGSPAPKFAGYNVLVIESGEAFRTGPAKGGPATPDYSGILDNKAAIEAARGQRTLISGADADFHAIRGDSGLCPGVHCGSFDGARGYVVNSINWAASGNGLGIVSFYEGEFPGSFWWDDPKSFLRNELHGYTQNFSPDENSAVIPGFSAGFPLNHGLTSTGLSNWFNSFHGGFADSIPGYTATVESGSHPGFSLSIATSAFANGGTGGPPASIPEPDDFMIFASGLLLLTFCTRRFSPLKIGDARQPC